MPQVIPIWEGVLALHAVLLGPIWNGGMQNRGIEKNTGIGKEQRLKTQDWKNIRIYRNWCSEQRNMASIGI